jgi:hypothetical protein
VGYQLANDGLVGATLLTAWQNLTGNLEPNPAVQKMECMLFYQFLPKPYKKQIKKPS